MRLSYAIFSVCVLLAVCVLLTQQACSGSGFFESLGLGAGRNSSGEHLKAAGGSPSGLLGSREEFAKLLTQLQWVFIGLGIAGIVASIWVPLISTRHAVASVAVGVGVALVKPFVVALYWPTVVCLGIAALAAVWPYLVAIYTWAKIRFTGAKPELTIGLASIKSLWQSRSVANLSSGANAFGGTDLPTDTTKRGI